MMMEVDARGLSCPQPVLMTRKAIDTPGSDEVIILLDTETAVENCTRIAEKMGCHISTDRKNGITRLRLIKP